MGNLELADLFVGGLAVLLGGLLSGAAAFNWEWGFQLNNARRIEVRFGRRVARIYYAVLGGILILLGLAIIAGFGPNKSPRGTSQSGLRDDAPAEPHRAYSV